MNLSALPSAQFAYAVRHYVEHVWLQRNELKLQAVHFDIHNSVCVVGNSLHSYQQPFRFQLSLMLLNAIIAAVPKRYKVAPMRQAALERAGLA